MLRALVLGLLLLLSPAASVDAGHLDPPATPYQGNHPERETLVVYAYHEAGTASRVRLQFFLEFGLQDNADFVFVVNGPSDMAFPNASNIHVIRRANVGFDFGSWELGLSRAGPGYTHYLFLNNAVKGPYKPHWTALFTDLLSEKVKVTGLNLNCPDFQLKPVLHIQSMVWATDRVGLSVLRAGGLFKGTEVDKKTAYQQESLLSSIISDAGYHIHTIKSHALGLPSVSETHGCRPEYGANMWCLNTAEEPQCSSSPQSLPQTNLYPFVKEKDLPYFSVLLVSPSLELEAAWMQLLNLSDALVHAGALVELAVPQAQPLVSSYFELLGVVVHNLGASATDKQAQVAAVRQLQAQLRYDVVVWNSVAFLREAIAAAKAHPLSVSSVWAHEEASSITDLSNSAELLLELDHFWTSSEELLRGYKQLVSPSGLETPAFGVMQGQKPMDLHVQELKATVRARVGFVRSPRNVPESVALLQRECTEVPSSHSKTAHTAVLVHASGHPIEYFEPIFPVLASLPFTVHLWVTTFDRALSLEIGVLAKKYDVPAHILMVRNKGLDVGPFFLVMYQIRQCQYQYEYVLKYHIKRGNGPVVQAMRAIWEQPGLLQRSVESLDSTPEIAAVYPHDVTRSTDGLLVDEAVAIYQVSGRMNQYYVQMLLQQLAMPLAELVGQTNEPIYSHFIQGTSWLARMKALDPWLSDAQSLWQHYLTLSTPNSVDWVWYHATAGPFPDQAAAEKHFETQDHPGHPYWLNWTKARDGMLEHAWERIFGHMFLAHGGMGGVPYVPSNSTTLFVQTKTAPGLASERTKGLIPTNPQTAASGWLDYVPGNAEAGVALASRWGAGPGLDGTLRRPKFVWLSTKATNGTNTTDDKSHTLNGNAPAGDVTVCVTNNVATEGLVTVTSDNIQNSIYCQCASVCANTGTAGSVLTVGTYTFMGTQATVTGITLEITGALVLGPNVQTFTISSDATLSLASGTVSTISNAMSFNGGGLLIIQARGTLTFAATIIVQVVMTIMGTSNVAAGGSVASSEAFSIGQGGIMNMATGTTATFTAASVVSGGGQIRAAQSSLTFTVLTLTGAVVSLTSSSIVSSTLNAEGGSFIGDAGSALTLKSTAADTNTWVETIFQVGAVSLTAGRLNATTCSITAPIGLGVRAAQQQRRLLAVDTTTLSPVVEVCSSSVGDGSLITVGSGGALEAALSCFSSSSSFPVSHKGYSPNGIASVVSGALTVSSGGYLVVNAVSASSNILSITGALTLDSGSALDVTLNGGKPDRPVYLIRWVASTCTDVTSSVSSNCTTCKFAVITSAAEGACYLIMADSDPRSFPAWILGVAFGTAALAILAAGGLWYMSKRKGVQTTQMAEFPYLGYANEPVKPNWTPVSNWTPL